MIHLSSYFVSEATVKTHISYIVSKLGTHDRAAAIVYAYNQGVVAPHS
ncbi:MAG: LuxR C-terminal-related transcriptional regulator [Gammaproteobacteria bacterium]|nr:LuxR C-terminal-related transcriptional regulator [Gammaproteobacteria bacterium]